MDPITISAVVGAVVSIATPFIKKASAQRAALNAELSQISKGGLSGLRAMRSPEGQKLLEQMKKDAAAQASQQAGEVGAASANGIGQLAPYLKNLQKVAPSAANVAGA